ncbi:MAG: sigma-70 family RNA polymerase sigma factor [Chthoniobacteraceae bacterium]
MLHSFDHHYLNDRVTISVGEPTDEELMARIQQRDEAALKTLHSRHQALMRTIISRMIHNDQDVDDLVQECLLEIWRRAEAYQVEKGHALGWIVTLVRRRTIDRIRRKMAYSRAQDRFREESATTSEGVHSGADEEVVQSDRGRAIARMIADLPPAQQEAVRLAYYRGMSQRQIAAYTGIPLGTIKTRLELALRKLRSAVLAFGELHEPFHAVHA